MPRIASEHPYFPLRVGTLWEYDTGQSPHGLGELPGSLSRERITEVRRQGELLVATVISEYDYSASAAATRQVTISPAGVSPDPTPMVTAAGMVQATASQGIYLPTELYLGARWSYALQLDSPLQTSRMDATLEVVDEGELEVPAGRFQVMHIASTLHNRMTVKVQAGVPPGSGLTGLGPAPGPLVDHTQIEDTYWARGIGLVKAATRTPQGYASVKELVRFLPGK